MSDQRQENSACTEIEERMAEVVAGTAPDELYAHIEDCDACRDARHDAEQAIQLISKAGADYTLGSDLEARLLGRLDQRFASDSATSTVFDEKTAIDALEDPATRTQISPTLRDEITAEPARSEVSAPKTPSQVAEPLATARPSKRRQQALLGTALAVAVAAGAALALRSTSSGPTHDAAATWRAKVLRIVNATGGKAGLAVCDPDGKSCSAVVEGAEVPAGSLVRTDGRTRAHIDLSDGSKLALDRGTELVLIPKAARRARLRAGGILVDVAHVERDIARFDLPRGWVEVLGTKFALRAAKDWASVDVSRGSVKLVDEQKRSILVRAGEEGRIEPGAPPYASAAPALGESLAWSESVFTERESEVAARGLGELKAKKPGRDQELAGAVTLTSHSVKVRIAGAVARTEIDEVFTNHTADVLEGIYRFPMPPDAKIERLALEVDGKLEEGAFVDRERAAAIWRGAIVNAAPQLRRTIQEEIVWVPGPWRDPALLEWQRAGRFELRIYPIPKQGSRRVILAYTQLIKPTGGVRRYNYPLAHDPSGSTKVANFDVDIQVRGHDQKFGVRSQTYALSRGNSSGDVEKLELRSHDFSPSGDLTLEYALPNRGAELTAWAYRHKSEQPAAQVSARTPVRARAAGAGVEIASVPGATSDGNYLAIALNPKLPRTSEQLERTFVLVVDASRSMFGESYKRATLLAARTIRELDPSDRVTVLACDVDCRALGGGLRQPGTALALEARRFLEDITPEGASDLVSAIDSARAAAKPSSGALRVVYIGDGSPTVGQIRPPFVARAVRNAVPSEVGSVTAVAVGADSDIDTLSALARGGGGVVLPYVPGQSTAEAAYALLGATYGNALRDVELELPAGLSEVSPRRLDTIISGSESLIVARTTQDELSGTVVLRGKLGKTAFEQRYPLHVRLSDAKGNAFVPRLFAATRIADLERETVPEAKTEAVRLSSAFDVASRYTSLLVLESPAMFKAFGLDNSRGTPEWTGEDAAESASIDGEIAVDDDAKAELDKSGYDSATSSISLGSAGGGLSDLGATGRSAGPAPAPSRAAPAARGDRPKPAVGASQRAPLSPPKEAKKEASAEKPLVVPDNSISWQPPARRMIPMRRIWERVGTVTTDRLVPKLAARSQIASAEFARQQDPNRRELVKKLYTLHALNADIEQARSVAEAWSSKEPLDAEALTARADLAARRGDRELAIRILGSVLDVRPRDVKAQQRLVRLHRWAGRPARACRHAIANAELHTDDAKLLAEAVRCARETGESGLADELLAASDAKTRKQAENFSARFKPSADELSGDVRLEATWSGNADLDLALLDGEGHRISWLGAPTRSVISARDVLSQGREGLGLRGAKVSEYVIEVVRASGSGPIRGQVEVLVAGTRRAIAFTMDGNRLTLGLAQVKLQPRLVPL